jgi:cell division protein FtsA
VAVFEEGEILHTAVLPVGGAHVTNDIALGLRTSLEVAEQVKLRCATCRPDEVSKKDEIDLADFGAMESEIVGRRFVADITEARVEEIFQMVDRELKKIDRSGMLPAGMVLTGGCAKLSGILEIAKDVLRLPVSLGTPIGISSVIERAHDPAMSTAIGLVLWGQNIKTAGDGGRFGNILAKFKGVDKWTGGLKKMFKSMKP